MPAFQLHSLGVLRLTGPEGELLHGRKELVLLVYLTRRGSRMATRQELAALLWGEREEARARQSLRQAVYTLRGVLGDRLEVLEEQVRLGEGALELDAAAFERDLADDRLADAVDRWKGEFLAGLEDAGCDHYVAWLEAEREGLRRRLGWALARLVSEAERRRAWDEAVHWAERWAAAFPLNEAAHTHFIRALSETCRTSEALASHASFIARTRDHFEAEPSAAFLALGSELEQAPTGSRGSRSAALLAPDLVGREDALATLEAAWDDAQRAGVMMLVEGEEGVGRSRLCRELLGRLLARPEPPLVLETRAGDADGVKPWATARRLFSGMARAQGLSGAPDRALAELSVLVPALRSRYPALPEPVGGMEALAVASARVLEDVAVEAPVLVHVDDLDLADAQTGALLVSVASDVPSGVLLLTTTRSNGFAATDLGRGLQDASTLRRIKLQSLSEAELETMLDSMFPLDAADRRDLTRRLYVETGGNPLYAVELVSALADAGILSPDSAGIWRVGRGIDSRSLPTPPRLRAAVLTRIDDLPDASRQVIEAAAVLGSELDPGRIEEVSGLSSSSIVAALDELVGRRLLRPPVSAGAGFEFMQELTRRIVYESLPESRRQALHRAALPGGAEVPQEPEAPPADLAAAQVGTAPLPVQPGGWRGVRRIAIAAAVVVGISLLSSAASFAILRWNAAANRGPALAASELRSPEHADAASRSVAVLPFANLSGSQENEYFSDGITEEILIALANVSDLRVISRTSAMRYRGTTRPIRQIAEELGVAHVLEGSVQREGERVRITAQLIDARTDQQLWAQRYDRPLGDIFAVQSEIAREIALALHVGLDAGERTRIERRPTTNPLAHDYVLRARSFLREPDLQASEAALELIREAVELDPAYPDAYAARAFALRVGYWWQGDAAWLDSAVVAAQHAIALDAEFAPGYAELGWALNYRGDREAALEAFRRTIELNPNLLDGLAAYVWDVGRLDEAAHLWQRVLETDPINGISLWLAGRTYLSLGMPARARAMFKRAKKVEPGFHWVDYYVSVAFVIEGRPQVARLEIERTVAAMREAPDALLWAGKIMALLGDLPEAQRYLERALPEASSAFEKQQAGLTLAWILKQSGDVDRAGQLLHEASDLFVRRRRGQLRRPQDHVESARIRIVRGDQEGAIRDLREAVRNGWHTYNENLGDPVLGSLRGDPRFDRLMAEVETNVGNMRARVEREGW